MISDGDVPRDLAALVVPLAGSVQDTGDVFVPCRLVDAAGAVVEPVSAFLAELQASGRSEATLKSYCKAFDHLAVPACSVAVETNPVVGDLRRREEALAVIEEVAGIHR